MPYIEISLKMVRKVIPQMAQEILHIMITTSDSIISKLHS